MKEDRKKTRYYRLATDSYRRSDGALWVSALACAGVVGNYTVGDTRGLASDMGVSPDTVEDLAHAYLLYRELCLWNAGEFRQFVRNARRAPFIYMSHFRALYDIRRDHNLTIPQVLDLLMDVVQAEGQISSRGVEGHARSRFGDNRGWEYYARRTGKELVQTLQQPDLPNLPEIVGNVYLISLDIGGKRKNLAVVADNPQRAENIARKILSGTIDPKIVKASKCIQNKAISEVFSDSKHLLNKARDWLEENS